MSNEKTNGKPAMLAPIIRNIPQEMRDRQQWINWRLQKNPKATGKPWTKIPLDPRKGRKAATTRPETWADFHTAYTRHCEFSARGGSGSSEGLGYILRGDHVGVDLDNCRDPQTGELQPFAIDIIRRLDSYTEVSPSGTGIRIICRGKLPPGARRHGAVEMYDESSPRYLTITGHALDGHCAIQDRQAAIEEVHAEYLGDDRQEATTPTPAISDAPDDLDEILARATTARNGDHFSQLWRGEWQGLYGSQSEADLALCGMLAFWCGPDADKLDALFRQSGLYRDKWERTDYREDTIRKATEGRTEFYAWGVDGAGVEAICTGGDFPAQPPKPKLKKPIINLKELIARPDPCWHLDRLFPEQSITVLWGQPNHGKSFVALEWGLCTATGTNWHGRRCLKGDVLYISAEGGIGLRKRILAWSEYHKRSLPDNFYLLPEALDMIRESEIDDLMQSINALGAHPKLIVIDTLALNLGGVESSDKDMPAFVRAINKLRLTYKSSVMPIHHTGWNTERERGHTSLRGAADTMISVAAIGQHITDGMELKCIKQRDWDIFDPIGLDWERHLNSAVSVAEYDATVARSEQKTTQAKVRQDDGLLPLLRILPASPDAAMTRSEIEIELGKSRATAQRLADTAYNLHYVTRVGTSGQGRGYAYFLTDTGIVARDTISGRKLLQN